jgi:hypothetical protein
MNKSACLFLGLFLAACAPNTASSGSDPSSTAALGAATSDPTATVKISTVGLASSGNPDDSITSSACISQTEQPAAQLEVRFVSLTSALQGTAFTDDSGEVKLTGPAGSYAVTVPGYVLHEPATPTTVDTIFAVDLYPSDRPIENEYLIVDPNLACP